MFAVKRSIRTLIFIILVNDISCQDVFTEHDFRRLQQQIASPDRHDALPNYNTQTEQLRQDQSGTSYNIQYHLAEENEDYRSNHGRSDRRKVIRIKNPFQRQLEDGDRNQQDNSAIKDSDGGASNQYTAMQYSLPPEDFLRQMRSESQFNQQYSTPAPAALSYTATPQPQYQYSTPAPSYDINQQSFQFGQLDSNVAQAQAFHGSPPSSYQFGGSYPFDGSASASASAFDNVQSTPSPIPPYLSTITNNQYIGTPASSYVSSAAPVVSSQANVQYVSSPAAVQTSSIDYSRSSTGASNSNYENSEINKRIQIDHYDNSATGIRYPVQQFSPNEYPSSTAAPPTSSPYSEQISENWNNSPQSNALAKSLQEATLAHYQNSPYYNLAQESRYDYQDTGDTHRVGNMPAANNIYLNYVHPEQPNNNARTRTRDLEQETGQPGLYSHGEYGWKLNEKKQLQGNDYYSQGSLPVHYQSNLNSDSPSSYFMSFRHDSSRPHNYESISKSAQESLDAQEFAKAAAKAHENNIKQQQAAKQNSPYFGHNYIPNFSTNDPLMNSQSQSQSIVSTFYGNLDKQKSKLFGESSNNNPVIFSSPQPDLITGSPYYIINTKDSADSKSKLPFDHAKALKQIVPIDVSNVINSNEAALKAAQENKLNNPNFSRDQFEQNMKQFYKPIADTYYKDKNTGYGFNIKAKPEDISGPEGMKPYEHNQQYYPKQQDSPYSLLDGKKYSEQHSPQNYQTQASSYSNNQQQTSNTPRPQNLAQSDFTSILKLNDIPYRLTQGIPPEALRLHNSNFDQANIPTPIPNKINQNVANHQLDVAILTKLLQQAKQQQNINGNIDLQPTAPMSTVNGFRVANPFNVDLKLVHEMLKGKPVIDDSKMSYLRDPYNKPMPMTFDMSAIQQLLLRNDVGNLGPLNDGFYGNPYADIYGRYPYQGVKYSRSQEEEESLIPIADASSNHPIGAVMEQYDAPDGREASSDSELTVREEEAAQTDDKQQKNVLRDLKLHDRHRHPNSLAGRHYFPRKYHKDDLEPYLLLKPPPLHSMRSRSSHSKLDRQGRRRVVGRKSKFPRSLKAEVFESESKTVGDEPENPSQILLQPPPIAESRSDKKTQKEGSS